MKGRTGTKGIGSPNKRIEVSVSNVREPVTA